MALSGWCGLLLACSSVSSATREQVLARIHEVNAQSEQRALSRFLRGEQATALDPSYQLLNAPRELGGLDARLTPSDSLVLRFFGSRAQVDLGMNWDTFNRAMHAEGRVEALTSSGEWLLLLKDSSRSETRGKTHYVRTPDGRVWILKTVLKPVRTHRVSVPYNCDSMPGVYPPSWSVAVLRGVRASEVSSWPRPLVFEGEDLTTRCASYTH